MRRFLKRTGLLCMAVLMVMVSVFAPVSGASVYAATGASLNAEEVELYSAAPAYYEIEGSRLPAIPADKKSFQIKVSGATASSYKVVEGDAVTVSSTGLIEPAFVTYYWKDGWGTTAQPSDLTGYTVESSPRFGDAKIRVSTDKGNLYVTVHVKDYAKIYADNVIDTFIAENITDDMTIEEKAEAATRYVAETTDYGNYQGYVSMIVVGAGDCWGSTDTIVEICRRMGLEAWGRNANKDGNAMSGHRNAIIKGDGCYYVADAGYGGVKPRGYDFYKKDDLFFFDEQAGRIDGGYLLAQYDGMDETHTELLVPAMIGSTKVVGLGEGFSMRSNEYDVWERIVLQDGIKTLKAGALQSVEKLRSVVLPATIETIEEAVFYGDSDLTDISIDQANPYFKAEGGAIYSKDGKRIVSAPSFSDAVIPEGVETIENYAFGSNKNVKNLIVPATVSAINEGAFSCSGLQMIRFEGDMPAMGNDVFYGLDLVIYYPKDNGTWKTDESYGASSVQWYAYDGDAGDFSACTVTPPADKYMHGDGAVEPEVTVYDGDKELRKGEDYTVTYRNNEEVGDAVVRLTGTGSYVGVQELPFTITPQLEFGDFGDSDLMVDETEYYCLAYTEEAQELTITSSDPSVAEVELIPEYAGARYQYFNIIPHKVGTVTITAEDSYGMKISKKIKVASDTGWVKYDGKWYYQQDGYIVWDAWIKDGGSWYYLGEDGVMVTNAWRKDSKGWCYLGADGRMVTNGWVKDSKGWCWIGANGYMPVATKWVKYGGEWYHITKGYRDQNKWMKDSSGWCYLGADGKMVRNVWKKDSKGWCYLGENGYMVTNDWAKDSKGWCWIGGDGYMPVATKWVKYDGTWYHITKGYRDQNKWMKDSKGWCWLQEDGSMLTNGWAKDSKGWCWIGPDGYMIEKDQWVDVGEDRYYIIKGYRVTGEQVIDDVTYTFDEEGRLVSE